MVRNTSLGLTVLLLLSSLSAWGQENPYTYVKMSLLVPWTLYFVFLAAVLIPFVLIILLAWRGHFRKEKRGPER
jgi:uncharacterized membrane protein